jgi:hypothetical protein
MAHFLFLADICRIGCRLATLADDVGNDMLCLLLIAAINNHHLCALWPACGQWLHQYRANRR